MTTTQVSIGQVKRDISELVNRVAFGNERIVLTSRGKPKAVIISIDDFERLDAEKHGQRQKEWKNWLAENNKLNDAITQRRKEVGLTDEIDLDAALKASRIDLDQRHEF